MKNIFGLRSFSSKLSSESNCIIPWYFAILPNYMGALIWQVKELK